MICDDCDKETAEWKIYIMKEYHRSYGRIGGYFCSNCLSMQIDGYHSGGGLHANVIKKIIRVKKK